MDNEFYSLRIFGNIVAVICILSIVGIPVAIIMFQLNALIEQNNVLISKKR